MFLDAGKVVTVTGKNYSKQLKKDADLTAKEAHKYHLLNVFDKYGK